ncbi:MAG: hypothetical protein C4530_16500 [Desulfobacteraceae bacterium]|nr:MAG: hypothetical protein C4530_16500 [Desulfobacteraceae bacterium]
MEHVFFLAASLFLGLVFAEASVSADLNGLWEKTTSADPHNLTIIYQEKNEIRALGFSQTDEKREVWYAAGEFDGGSIRLNYRYSIQAVPQGWEPAGTMTLTLSDDGNTLSGNARSTSGNWSGPIAFRRIR